MVMTAGYMGDVPMSDNPTYEKLKQQVKKLEKKVAELGQMDDRMRLLSLAIEQSNEGMAIVDLDGNLQYLNAAFAKMHEYSVKELIGKNLSIFHTPQHMASVEAANKQVKKTGSFKGEIWHVTRNGTEFSTLTHNSLLRNDIGNPMGIIVKLRNITDLKGKEALLKSEKMYRLLADNATDVIWTRDMDLNLTYLSPSIEKLIGYSVEEVVAIPDSERMTPASMVLITKTFEEELKLEAQGHADPSRIRTLEIEMIRKDGSRVWVEVTMRFIRNETGQAVGILGISRDITQRKQTEEVLLKREEKYREIFENIQDVYYETSIDGTILELSPSIENISHYKKEELIGKSSYDIYTHPEQREELLSLLLDKGRTNDFEIFFTDKDGSQRPCTINVVLIKDEQGNPIKIIGSLRDISERKQLEARLRHAQKMESIGTLAGGIAHEFNNMLGIIIGNAELAADDIPEWSPVKECLDEIRSASLRASDVIKQILSFARKDVTEREPLQLTPIIKESLKLLRASFPTTIEISQDISCEFDTVLTNPMQISQVLMNLCTNAAQAMREHSGVLKVTLKNVEFGNQDAGLDITPGRYVKLTVSDTGHGIEPEIMDRIFDPYFTTKEMGQGMGLSVVHGIVKSCHGIITVHSGPEKGSVFEVLLPVIEAETELNVEKPDTLPTGTERILFVDDEPSLVNMVRQILERLGYQIETKRNPIEALELFRSRPDQFDLVITDMTMPEMTGQKLVKEILNIRPDMPIILCTGYSEKITKEKAGELGINTLVFKPFAVRDFTLTVRKVLDEKIEYNIFI